MGLFSSRKPQGMFGNMMPADDWSQIATQPLNDAAPMGQIGQIPNTQAMPKKHEAWRDILGFALGTLGDGIAMNQGRAPMIGPMMMQQKLEQQKYQRTMAEKAADRATTFADQKALYDYKRQNPDPGDDSFTRAMAAAGYQPGTPEYLTLARRRAEMLTNPVQLVSDSMGGMTPVRPYGGGQMPTAPVGKLTPIGGALQAPQAAPQNGIDPNTMRRLYTQQFGPQGEAMFQEWLRKTQGGQ